MPCLTKDMLIGLHIVPYIIIERVLYTCAHPTLYICMKGFKLYKYIALAFNIACSSMSLALIYIRSINLEVSLLVPNHSDHLQTVVLNIWTWANVH